MIFSSARPLGPVSFVGSLWREEHPESSDYPIHNSPPERNTQEYKRQLFLIGIIQNIHSRAKHVIINYIIVLD